MTIVLCGGGSGGHITPLLAVASELRKQHKDISLIYIGERGGKFQHIVEKSNLFDERHYISAGKLRRYHGESWITRLFDFKTNILNIRDMFRLSAGLLQSRRLLKKLKPNAVLLKGGFVCVPVALAASRSGISCVTHDSDALPGLSNRIAARWAKYHATAMPAQYYSYPQSSIRVVGVPTDERFREYSSAEQRILREKYGIAPDAEVLLITGGSNGARRMNEAVTEMLPGLLKAHPKLHVFYIIGAGNEDQAEGLPSERVDVIDFAPELFHMSAIADVVITRAGATSMADFGAQSKACVVVPNPFLTGGHQLKNAKVYEDAQAAVIVSEDEIQKLYEAVDTLLTTPSQRIELGKNLYNLSPEKPAAVSLAALLLEVAQ